MKLAKLLRLTRQAGWLLIIMPFLGQTSLAQTTLADSVFSIKDCIEYASRNNSTIKLSRFDEEIARQQTAEVRGRGLPQASINGLFEDRIKIPVQLIPNVFGRGADTTGGQPVGGAESGYIPVRFGTKYSTSLSGEVTQRIIDPSLWVGLKAAKVSTKLYQQSTRQVSEQTAYGIANAYYQVVTSQKQLELLRANLASTEKILQTTELQLKNGVAKRVDVNRLRVNANNLQSMIRQSELAMTQAYNNLKYQMGMPLEQSIALSDTAYTFRPEDMATDAQSGTFFENRIDYQILQTNLELQELDRKNNAVGYYPTLSAYGNYAFQAQRQTFNFFESGQPWFQSSAIGLRLTIPVFDGLQRNARIQQSRLNSEKVKERIHLSRQTINREVSDALSQYRSTIQRIEAEEQTIQLANEVYGVTQLEFREGVSTSTDVVNAETSLREAQNNYITTLLDLYRARLDLERAKGNLVTYLNEK